ncbi:MAG: nitroreductase family protein [Verrucomicrobia bacterium]|nr:nitroreductase family protein [Verrucomicrobiota bacterium]
MDALAALKTRRSVRAYRTDPVSPSIIEDIVDCGRLAATARNIQPWEFVVVTHAVTRKKLADMIDTGRFIAEAPVCIVVFCRDVKYYLEDGSAAIQNILLAAHAHGLGSCWVAGDKKPYCAAVAQMLNAPPDQKLIGLVAIGRPAKPASVPPKRALQEVLHRERF